MSNGIWSGTAAGAGAWAKADVPSNAKLAAQGLRKQVHLYFLPDWFCLWQTMLASGPKRTVRRQVYRLGKNATSPPARSRKYFPGHVCIAIRNIAAAAVLGGNQTPSAEPSFGRREAPIACCENYVPGSQFSESIRDARAGGLSISVMTRRNA
jgi:hypothetical protein